MSVTDGLWSDWSPVVKRSKWQPSPQSTARVTRLIDTKSLLQVTAYHGDNTHKFSRVEMILPGCSACDQQTTLRRCQVNWRQHESGFAKIPQHESGFAKIPTDQWGSGASRSGLHIVGIPLQRWNLSLFEVSGGRKRLSSMTGSFVSTNNSDCDKPFESVTGTNIHLTGHGRQPSTMEKNA